MAESDEIGDGDGLAAEYVLGTLSASERAEVDRRLRQEPELARTVRAWERRLDPLLEAIRPVPAPPQAYQAIKARIGGAESMQPPNRARTAEIIDLQRRLRRWRSAAIGAAALAASLVGFVVVFETAPVRDEKFVAVLEGDDRNPAFVAAVSLKTKSITVLSVRSLAPSPGHSHELWALSSDNPAPRSLGLLSAKSRFPADKIGAIDPAGLRQTTFAISVEPEGGSPTGQPTGPVVFTGKLVPVPGK